MSPTKNQLHKQRKILGRHRTLLKKVQESGSGNLKRKLRNLEARMRREGLPS